MIYLRDYAASVCDEFESLLDKHGIDIPDEDREGKEGECRIYGITYAELEDNVMNVLFKLAADISVELTDYFVNHGNESSNNDYRLLNVTDYFEGR